MNKETDNIENKESNLKIIIVSYMLLYLVITLFTVKDYGWFYDDNAQRTHCLVTYKYLNKTFLNRDLSGYDDFYGISELEDYNSRYYGVALQLPLVVIEDIFHFALPTRTVF